MAANTSLALARRGEGGPRPLTGCGVIDNGFGTGFAERDPRRRREAKFLPTCLPVINRSIRPWQSSSTGCGRRRNALSGRYGVLSEVCAKRSNQTKAQVESPAPGKRPAKHEML
jgi:hypothetical protein